MSATSDFRAGAAILAIACLTGAVGCVVFAFSCRAAGSWNTPLPKPLAAVPTVTMESALEPAGAPILGALSTDTPSVTARTRIIYGRTACRGHNGVNPLVIPGLPGPIVGREWQCLFVTSACPLPKEPDWPAWILTSARPMPTPVDFTPYRMPGCWILVNPDQIVPVPPVTGGMFYRDGGRTTLRWAPSAANLGASHFFQFVTLSPGGFLASPGLEVQVGNL